MTTANTELPELVQCGETPLAWEDVLGGFRLDGRRAVVTGASAGIGRRIARVLHAAGAHVAVAARRESRLEELCGELGERAIAVRCDVADEQDRDALMDQAIDAFGGVDLLVNNAGMLDVAPSEEQDLQQYRDTIETNLVAAYHLCQRAARSMLEQQGGSIINIASILGLVAGTPFTCAGYVSSKGGIVNLTRELGAQWGPRGIRVNAIAPGYFPTEMTAHAQTSADAMGYIAANTPLGRMGHEHELDTAVLFLAGSGSSYVTGQTIAVDGGWTIR